jgi:hypothetical protein
MAWPYGTICINLNLNFRREVILSYVIKYTGNC